jgi:uncharacterized protein (DUF1778 family)
MPRGRKPVAGVKATVRVWIKLTPDDAAALREIARLNQKTRAAFVRDAIQSAVAECGEQWPRQAAAY